MLLLSFDRPSSRPDAGVQVRVETLSAVVDSKVKGGLPGAELEAPRGPSVRMTSPDVLVSYLRPVTPMPRARTLPPKLSGLAEGFGARIVTAWGGVCGRVVICGKG